MQRTPTPSIKPFIRGRGTSDNPAGRFEHQDRIVQTEDYDQLEGTEDLSEEIQVKTTVLTDTSRTIISTNDSPDIGMETTLNPYRGCEHGCIYCYARPTHEYLGLSAGVDFETKIFAKYDAAALLREKLSSKSWTPKVISFSGITDCYQPLEAKLRITRQCLEVLNEFRNPVSIVTKNRLVTRDIDLFKQMHSWNGIGVLMSVTSLNAHISRTMEPRASQPSLRLKAIEELARNSIPVSVMIGPVVPGLTDHEIPAILKSCADAGATGAHYTMLRLPYGVKDLFQSWAHTHFPDRAERILSHIRDIRGGKLNSSEFGTRMRGEGVFADNIADMFHLYKKKYGLERRYHFLSTEHFRKIPQDGQMDLFG